jgi:hypothetical protein
MYIIAPTTSGAASCPRVTPVEKVKASLAARVAGADLGQRAVPRAGVILRRHRPFAVGGLRRGKGRLEQQPAAEGTHTTNGERLARPRHGHLHGNDPSAEAQVMCLPGAWPAHRRRRAQFFG